MSKFSEIQARATEIALKVARAAPHEKDKRFSELVDELPAEEQSLAYSWCGVEANMAVGRQELWKRIDRYVALGTGVLFLVAFLIIAIFIPAPTVFQQQMFRTVLALIAGLFGQALTGTLTVEAQFGTAVKWALRAAGGFALFIIIYFLVPSGVH